MRVITYLRRQRFQQQSPSQAPIKQAVMSIMECMNTLPNRLSLAEGPRVLNKEVCVLVQAENLCRVDFGKAFNVLAVVRMLREAWNYVSHSESVLVS